MPQMSPIWWDFYVMVVMGMVLSFTMINFDFCFSFGCSESMDSMNMNWWW